MAGTGVPSPADEIERVHLHPSAVKPGRAALVVLGCAKNGVEAETLASRLATLGWTLTGDIPSADVVVVHSCGFVGEGRKEARRTVLEVRREAPEARVVLTGCYAQYLNGRRPAGADAALGTGQLHLLPSLLARIPQLSARTETGEAEHFSTQNLESVLDWHGREILHRKVPASTVESRDSTGEFGLEGASMMSQREGPGGYHEAAQPRPLRPGQLSAYLRVAEGCDHRCSFCVIPQLRGSFQPRPLADIQREAENLVSRGVRELVLISQDTTAYKSPEGCLVDVVRRLLSATPVSWLRLLYAYPSEVTDDLIDLLAQEGRLTGYLDMPLQHLSDPMLAAMKREGDSGFHRRLLDRLHRRVKHLVLRTTFLVGFPGETDSDVEVILDAVRQGLFEHVGVFVYSNEERAPSSRMAGQVPRAVAEERRRKIYDAQSVVMARRGVERRGQEVSALVERGADGAWSARTVFQAPEVDGQLLLADVGAPGLYRVELTHRQGVDWQGRILEEVVA